MKCLFSNFTFVGFIMIVATYLSSNACFTHIQHLQQEDKEKALSSKLHPLYSSQYRYHNWGALHRAHTSSLITRPRKHLTRRSLRHHRCWWGWIHWILHCNRKLYLWMVGMKYRANIFIHSVSWWTCTKKENISFNIRMEWNPLQANTIM